MKHDDDHKQHNDDKAASNLLDALLSKEKKYDELHRIIKRFAPNHLFVFLKGLGYTLAIGIALVGALLTWNAQISVSQSDSLQQQINRKIDWMVKVNDGATAIREAQRNIVLECQYGKPPSQYEQDKTRVEARYQFIRSANGVGEIFGEKTLELVRNFVQFDESVPDVCSKSAPRHNAWLKREIFMILTMQNSIDKDKKRLESLTYTPLFHLMQYFESFH